MDNAMDDDSDPIVQERTVYLSKQLRNNLLLLQYPVRSANRTYDNSSVLATRVKPKQQCVEIELAIDMKSRHYSSTGAKDSNCSDKQVLTSMPSGGEISHYAIGVLSGNELHLTPLNGVVQLRPNYNYIDARTAAQLAAETSAAADVSIEDGDDDARAVTVRFRPHESEDALARRMASYEHHRRLADEEPWIAVRHFPLGSEESEIERSQLFAEPTAAAGSDSEFYMAPSAYQNVLIPRMEAEVAAAVTALPNDVLSLAVLKTMSFADRIRALIRSVRAMRFSELLAVLKSLTDQSPAPALDVHDILRHLQQFAVLVHGCWVVKSDVLYTQDSASELTGTPADALCRARDYVLWRFEQGRAVSRQEIAANAVRLAPEDEREILDKIARRSSAGRGWEFRMEKDVEFLSDERFRPVIKRQESLWQQWQVSKTEQKQITATASAETTSPKQKRVRGRTKSSCSAGRGERSLSMSMSDQSDSDLVETPRRGPGKRVETVTEKSTQKQQSNPSSDAVAEVTQASDDGSAVSQSESTSNNRSVSSCILPVSTPSTALVDFARDRLKSRTALTVATLRSQLEMFLASAPAGTPLGSVGLSSTPAMLELALTEAGAARIDVASASRSGAPGDSVFVLSQRSDANDALRAVIIDMLRSRQTLKLNSVRKMMEKKGITMESGSGPSDNDLRSVLKEYCVTRGGCWTLKETATMAGDS